MRSDRGQALVELAITLPLVLSLIASVLLVTEIGVTRLALEHGAAEAARTGALTNDDALVRATAGAAVTPLDPARVSVTIDPPGNRPPRTSSPRGSLLRVVLRYPVAIPLGFAGVPRIVVEGAAVRRIEWSP